VTTTSTETAKSVTEQVVRYAVAQTKAVVPLASLGMPTLVRSPWLLLHVPRGSPDLIERVCVCVCVCVSVLQRSIWPSCWSTVSGQETGTTLASALTVKGTRVSARQSSRTGPRREDPTSRTNCKPHHCRNGYIYRGEAPRRPAPYVPLARGERRGRGDTRELCL
jgi:hypothetical protein